MKIVSRSTSSDVCPPTGLYNVILLSIGDTVHKDALPDTQGPTIGQITKEVDQSMWKFEIVDYDFDPDDTDDYDWNGETVDQYYTFYTTYKDSGNIKDTYLANNSGVFPFLTALMGRDPERGDEIEFDSFIGKKLTVHIGPKPGGKPKLSNPVIVKTRKPKAQPAPVEADEDDVPFDETKVA